MYTGDAGISCTDANAAQHTMGYSRENSFQAFLDAIAVETPFIPFSNINTPLDGNNIGHSDQAVDNLTDEGQQYGSCAFAEPEACNYTPTSTLDYSPEASFCSIDNPSDSLSDLSTCRSGSGDEFAANVPPGGRVYICDDCNKSFSLPCELK